MWLFQIIGIITTASLVLFLLLFIIYSLFVKEAKPFIKPDKMPILIPLPIATKNRGFLMKILVWFFEVRQWQLSENWFYRLDDRTEIVLPRDFIFDGASIPRPFWGILSPVGLLLIPGLIHDYGYKHDQLWERREDQIIEYKKEFGKSYWDKLFLKVGKDVNGLKLIDLIAWFAVAIGGKGAWKKHRKNYVKPTKPVL